VPADVTAPRLSILIPAYNEAAGLAGSVGQVLAKVAQLGVPAEVIIVDDGSRDGTGAVADRLAAADGRVRVIHHPQNRGIGGGFVSGVAAARGEWFILIPADLAIELDELSGYLAAAEQADLVVGVCPDRSDYTRMRRLVSWANVRLIQLLFGVRQRQFNYISLYRLVLLRQLSIEYGHSAFFFAEVIIKAQRLGARVVEVETIYVPRASGRATGAHWRLILATGRDMLHFWWRLRRRGEAAGRR
jgi:glycosyltransferase involved in cell wall biosynthesis